MPKRRDVLKKIKEAAEAAGLTWVEDREGANHTVYKLDGLMIPVARHRDFDERYAVMVYKECAAKLGEDWWK